MGAVQAARVDGAALVSMAGRYDAAASIVDAAVRTHLSALSFDGSAAGRGYAVHGDALRAAVDDVVAALQGWARSAADVAAALRATAVRYAEADADAASRVR
ncbi:type VII secretion target [Mycolicibacterium baixiangningiae]|uniref:type VII secretion target n=1 Tax=Mycolicibacterium baixiangningiae TaxID=2761578 RepID=UPI0018D0CF1B|nr:type VII secretion target [Mycolicibacterium baixiangningiae]